MAAYAIASRSFSEPENFSIGFEVALSVLLKVPFVIAFEIFQLQGDDVATTPLKLMAM